MSEMRDFFVEDVHTLWNCEENESKVRAYLKSFEKILFDAEKSLQEVKESFVLYSLNYAKACSTMIRLKKYRNYVLDLLGAMKHWHDENKSLAEKLNRKFLEAPGCSKPTFEGKLKKLLKEIEKEPL